jgi:hypothetical protein
MMKEWPDWEMDIAVESGPKATLIMAGAVGATCAKYDATGCSPFSAARTGRAITYFSGLAAAPLRHSRRTAEA